MNKRLTGLISDTLLFGLASLGSKFIMFFLLPLYTNVLSSDQYGTTELITIASNLIIPFITLSINDSILIFGLDKSKTKEDIFQSFIFILFGASLILILASRLIPFSNSVLIWKNYFLLITISQMFRTAFVLFLKSCDKIKVFALDNIIYTISLAVFNIYFLVILREGIKGYFSAILFAQIISLLFQFTFGRFYRFKIIKKVNTTLIRDMILYSSPLIINAVSWWIITSSDRFMIGYFNGPKEVGVYSVASKIPILITAVTGIFLQAWVISSVKEYNGSQDKNYYKMVFKNYSLFLCLFSSIFLIILKPFIKNYIGYNFFSSWRYVPFLLIGSLFFSITTFFVAIYKSAKKNIREMNLSLISSVINIMLNFVFIPKYSIMGAVIATLLTNIITSIFIILDTRKFFKFEIDLKKLIINLTLVLFQSVVVTLNIFSVIVSPVILLLLIGFNLTELKGIFNFIIYYTRRKYAEKS